MRYTHHWNVKSCLWLRYLLLRLWKRLLTFWVILMLLTTYLRRILMIEGLRKTVWDWRRQVIRCGGRLRVAMCVGMQLLLLLARVIFLNRQRRLGKSCVVAVRKYLRRWRVLRWR